MFTTIADETGIGDPTRGESMETVGFHLVGLPDIVIEDGKLTNPRIYTNGDQFEIAGFTDSIATRMTENGSVETIARDNTAFSATKGMKMIATSSIHSGS